MVAVVEAPGRAVHVVHVIKGSSTDQTVARW